MMRGLIIDKVRARHAQKRGGGMIITSLSAENADYVLQPDSLEGVSEALDHLATVEPELAVVVDLKFFCGFTFGEIAEMHGISARTVQRQWEKARILLLSILST
jgi:DNA-directed RNA polymerase specialized sigma24 family protein